jgi:hypothetical protein
VTRCDEGPPSAQERASWKRGSQPRALEGTPLAALTKESDSDLVTEVIDRVLDRLYTVGLARMTRAERNVYFFFTLQSEVHNGGFEGFFSNSSGNCALQIGAALADMSGFGPWAAVYRRALAPFPGGRPPEDRATRGEQMEAMHDEYTAWWDVEGDFFKLPSSDPLLAAYIRGHVASFPRVVPRP